MSSLSIRCADKMSRRTKIYLICGGTGAGKTTIAKKMEVDLPAYRISHDEMLLSAYGEKIEKDKFRECCERINRIVWMQVERLSKLGVDIVLEGWGSLSLRDQAREEIERIGIDHEFIYVDCPQEVRFQRVKKRNQKLNGEGYFISEEDFRRMEGTGGKSVRDEKFTRIDNSKHNKDVERNNV